MSAQPPRCATATETEVVVSVVMPVHNEERFVAEQLDALAQQRFRSPWELIVVDSHCSDRSIEIIEGFAERFPNLRIVKAVGPRNAAHARNVGVAAAKGTAIAFCDADDVVGDGWLAAMAEGISRLGFVACRIDHGRLNTIHQRTARGLVQQPGLLSYYRPYLPYSGSGTLGVRKSIHEEIGGFDETFTKGGEDPDYCWRIQLAGHQLHFLPDAVISYRHRDSWRGMWRQARNYGRFHVHLYAKYQNLGLPAVTHQWRAGCMLWARLAFRLAQVRGRDQFGGWLWKFGWSLGLLEGTVDRRVLFVCSDPADAMPPEWWRRARNAAPVTGPVRDQRPDRAHR